MSLDHRALLKKYIDHVGQSEGVTFIYDITPDVQPDSEPGWDSAVFFTQEEYDELVRLAEESSSERYRSPTPR